MMDPASCTVGPSRPTDAPPPSATTVSMVLASTARSDMSARAAGPIGSRLAAMTCGMPEPLASLAKRRVSAATTRKVTGVRTSGSQTCSARTEEKRAWA